MAKGIDLIFSSLSLRGAFWHTTAWTHEIYIKSATCLNYVNCHLKNEASITLYCQPITQQHKSKSIIVIKVATVKNMDNFFNKKKPSHATAKLTSFAVTKMNKIQRRTLVSLWKCIVVQSIYHLQTIKINKKQVYKN